MNQNNTQNKKVLLFTESIGSGGAERQMVGLAISLKKRGYDVTVLTYLKQEFYKPMLQENGVKYILCEKALNKYLRLFYIWQELRRINPDTIISFLSAPSKVMCILKPRDTRLIVSERNTTLLWGGYERVVYWLYRRADVIVANSENEAENIKAHKPAVAHKTLAITNFVDTDLFVPAPHSENEVPIILCVGRITEQKNVLRFIDAVKMLKGRGQLFIVKWFGNHMYKDYCAEVYKKVEALELQDVFLIHEPSSNIREEYQRADIFCLPSIHEGYPNVVCEAMSCELPIACSNVCENPRIVHEGVNGFLFNPSNASEMADVLSRTLDMTPAERKAMGQKNRQQMIDNNSIEAFCDKYIDILW